MGVLGVLGYMYDFIKAIIKIKMITANTIDIKTAIAIKQAHKAPFMPFFS